MPVDRRVFVMSAVVGVHEELQTTSGHVIPIGKLEEANRKEVGCSTMFFPEHGRWWE